MKKSKNVQEPQNRGDHHDRIQDGLNRSLHRYETVDQPKQNAYHDQNYQYLHQRHRLSLLFAGRHSAGPGVGSNLCLVLVPDGVGRNLRSPVSSRGKPSDLVSPGSSGFTHTQHLRRVNGRRLFTCAHKSALCLRTCDDGGRQEWPTARITSGVTEVCVPAAR